MASIWIYSIVSVLVVSAVSFVGVFTLSLKASTLKRVVFMFVSVSVGALFGEVFIHLLPESFETGEKTTVSLLVLGGIMLFFVLEKFLNWKHVHGEVEEDKEAALTHDHSIKPLGPMVLVSDSLHNFVDGIVIGASFLVSVELGIATTIAVVLHEIPQEMANFGVLLHAGYEKMRALLLNFISALFAVLGAIVAISIGEASESLAAIILPIAAGNFIYIAGSDLVPELQKTSGLKGSVAQFLCIIAGILLMLALLLLE
jgi:zinc and cadmium transporter